MVTSSENIGISRLTGVRSRYVTAAAGVLLVAVGLLSPVSRAVAGIPPAVVGGSALVVYALIAVMGVQMLARSDLAQQGQSMIAALALAVGLLPVVAPQLYAGFPSWVRTVLGSGVVAGTLTAVVLHGVFAVVGRGSGATPAPATDRASKAAVSG
jgi:xanthine/uracil permease